MGEPCMNWFFDIEMQEEDDFFNQCQNIETFDDEDEMFREMMHQPFFSSDNDSYSPTPQTNSAASDGGIYGGTTTIANNNNHNPVINNNNFNSIFPQHAPQKLAATRQTYGGKQPYHGQVSGGDGGGALPPSKEEVEILEPRVQQGTRKVRSSSETIEHIVAERKRRRELTERFIALSATIPGLKKIDKSTILSEAITHVKQLRQRVRDLEEQSKKISLESVLYIQKSHIATEKGITYGAIMNRENEALPIVEARILKKEVLIRIHCEKQSDIVLKILGHLKSFDLSTISNSVLPFGNSTLDISVIAQVDDKFNLTMNDLVKNLRLALMESPKAQQQ